MKLKERLAQLLPNMSAARRKKALHGFLISEKRRFAAFGRITRTDGDIEQEVMEYLIALKKESLCGGEFQGLPEWHHKEVSRRRAEAGKRGGDKKESNKRARARAKKRQQTKPEFTYVGDMNALDAIANPNPKKRLPPSE